jgi:hypothetical protein
MHAKLTNLSIRSHYNYNGRDLRSWTLEDSRNGSPWLELDLHENDLVTNNQGMTAAFSMSRPSEFHKIPHRQLSLMNSGNDYLVQSFLELITVIVEP